MSDQGCSSLHPRAILETSFAHIYKQSRPIVFGDTASMDQPFAVRMQLRAGCAVEYERRHDRIWPELAELLSDSGIYDYSIFLGPDDASLFAVMRLRPGFDEATLIGHPLMRRWWDYMADLMVVHEDNRPVQWPMRRVFRLEESHRADPGTKL